MRTLVYKQTHSDDPDDSGQWGVYDCMRSVRAWDYEAVIGVGGLGELATKWDIACKLTWVGIGPRKLEVQGMVGPLVTFDHFWYKGANGPESRQEAPRLAELMYEGGARTVMNFTDEVQAEVDAIVGKYMTADPSSARQVESVLVSKSCVRSTHF